MNGCNYLVLEYSWRKIVTVYVQNLSLISKVSTARTAQHPFALNLNYENLVTNGMDRFKIMSKCFLENHHFLDSSSLEVCNQSENVMASWFGGVKKDFCNGNICHWHKRNDEHRLKVIWNTSWSTHLLGLLMSKSLRLSTSSAAMEVLF